MQERKFREANSFCVIQEILRIFEPENPLTCTYPEPHKFSPQFSTPFLAGLFLNYSAL